MQSSCASEGSIHDVVRKTIGLVQCDHKHYHAANTHTHTESDGDSLSPGDQKRDRVKLLALCPVSAIVHLEPVGYQSAFSHTFKCWFFLSGHAGAGVVLLEWL